VKIGEDAGRIYVEVHDDVYRRIRDLERHAFAEVEKAGLATQVDGALLRAAVHQKSGIPVDVTRSPERTRGGAQAPAPRSESPARRLLPSTRR
jgi:L,D-transpeptidase ErfK/SrfK